MYKLQGWHPECILLHSSQGTYLKGWHPEILIAQSYKYNQKHCEIFERNTDINYPGWQELFGFLNYHSTELLINNTEKEIVHPTGFQPATFALFAQHSYHLFWSEFK